MANVTINGPGTITGQFNYTAPDGTVTTFYGWTFPVTVDGQSGVYTVWIDSDTDAAAAANDAQQDLEQDPGALQGVSDNDSAGQPGDFDGDPSDNFGDDDGQLADGEGGPVDVGESV